MDQPDRDDDLMAAGRGDDAVEMEDDLPEHLARLPGGPWAVWRWVGLRGAGFPAARVLSLAAPECAAAADRIVQAEDAVHHAREAVLDVLIAALRARLASCERDDAGAYERLAQETRRIRQQTVRKLRQGRLPDPGVAALVGEAAIEAFRASLAHVESAWSDYRQAFAAAIDQLPWRLQEIAGDERFREAVIWQNRTAFHTGVAPLLRTPPAMATHRSQRRRHEELVANYAQRYCTKNDTIGFFGPLGWVYLSSDGPTVAVTPGKGLLAARTVYFEGWCIDALARKLVENQALLPWVAPRRTPFIHIDGTTLYLGAEHPLQLSIEQAAVLQACDGARTAKEIAAELTRSPTNGLKSETEIYNLLRALGQRGLIVWTLEVPLELYPERTLQRLLERVGDDRLRGSALAALNKLDTARTRVARAAGAPQQLDQALADLDATFTELTRLAPTRSAGEIYAGRTLVYEDCRRAVDIEFGPDLLKTLGPPLSLLLTSARWLTFQVATHYREAFRKIYADLTHDLGSATPDLTSFWTRAQPLLTQDSSLIKEMIVPTFQDLWAGILDIPADQCRVAYTSEELRPRVDAAFDAPAPGWRSAPYHSPDVLIAAPGIEAIARGDYQFVMGEIHVGINTLSSAVFVAQHPYPEDLRLAFERDMTGPRIMPVIPRTWYRTTTRTRPALVSLNDYRLVFAADSPGVPKSRALPIGALVVEDVHGDLVVRTRDGRLRFDLIETFATLLSMLAANVFRIVRPRGHSPRVTIDRLVVCRESWSCDPGELSFAYAGTDADRFLAARRWARAREIPRQVFVKVPVEDKPFYVDFESPIYIDIFAKMIRRTIEAGRSDVPIVITEMLPGLEETWLPDAEGRSYTSELRLVAIERARTTTAT